MSSCASYEYLHKATVNENNYPISMSGQLFDEKLEPIITTENMKVGELKIKKSIWNLGTGTYPLGKTRFDFSDEINAQVQKVGRNAVIYFKIDSEISFVSVLSWTTGYIASLTFHLLSVSDIGYFESATNGLVFNALGIGINHITPGYNTIEVTGTIVNVPEKYWNN